jgi:hypothetical protein
MPTVSPQPGSEVDSDSPPSPALNEHRFWRWFGTAVGALGLVGAVGGYFVNLALDTARDQLIDPLTVSLEDRTSSPNYLFPPTVEPRSAPVDAEEPNDAEFRRWAERNSGIPYDDRAFELELRGRDAAPVIINAIRVEVVERTALPSDFWLNAWEGCGAVLPVRLLMVDLSQDPPSVRVFIDGIETPSPKFTVSNTEIEVFEVQVTGGDGVTSWMLRVEYDAGGRDDVLDIEEVNGAPLRLAGGGDPAVFSPLSGKPWLTQDDEYRQHLREGNPVC